MKRETRSHRLLAVVVAACVIVAGCGHRGDDTHITPSPADGLMGPPTTMKPEEWLPTLPGRFRHVDLLECDSVITAASTAMLSWDPGAGEYFPEDTLLNAKPLLFGALLSRDGKRVLPPAQWETGYSRPVWEKMLEKQARAHVSLEDVSRQDKAPADTPSACSRAFIATIQWRTPLGVPVGEPWRYIHRVRAEKYGYFQVTFFTLEPLHSSHDEKDSR